MQVSIPIAPDYCNTPGRPLVQLTKPAKISKSGAFSGTISYELILKPQITAKTCFKGRFSGKKVTGTVRSEFLLVKGCDGSTSFSAKKQ